MTDEQRLKKIIEKAVGNGYIHTEHSKWIYANLQFKDAIKEEMIMPIIFSHDFAKAYWGEEKVCNICGEKWGWWYQCRCGGKVQEYVWQYHLQRVVVLVDGFRLEYMEKFL